MSSHEAVVDEQVLGTVYLVDVNGCAASDLHDASHKDIMLVPRPSADPNDPLNWSTRRKLTTVGMVYICVLSAGIATSLQYSVLANITADTGISTATLVQGTGVMFLFFGWACLIWQPIALTYGRRGVYLITSLLAVPLMVWTAYSTSGPEWFAHRVLLGIVVSPIESLCEITVLDLFFAHNRGAYMGLYVFILFGFNFLAPLMAGWFNDAFGWRWTMHFGAMVCAAAFVIMFFFMEETIYFRDHAVDGERIEQQPMCASLAEDGKLEKSTSNSMTPSPTPSLHGIPKPDINKGWQKYKPFKSVSGRFPNMDMIKMAYRPVLMIFQFPTVAWCGFLYGINLAWYNVLNGTASPVLSSAPYNWSAALVGCVYAGPILGAAIASLWSGNAADWNALQLAKRNNGVREPEYRLWVLLVSSIMSAAGLITWGVGAYHDVHWVGLVFGLGMLTFGCVTGGSIAVSYNADCFKEIARETTVSIMLIRNTIGFAISYAITPCWTDRGLQNCFVTAGMVSLACTFTFFIMIIWGKSFRRRSIAAYRKYMATSIVSHD